MKPSPVSNPLLAALSDTGKPGSHKPSVDASQPDQLDFGAELGAMLTLSAPLQPAPLPPPISSSTTAGSTRATSPKRALAGADAVTTSLSSPALSPSHDLPTAGDNSPLKPSSTAEPSSPLTTFASTSDAALNPLGGLPQIPVTAFSSASKQLEPIATHTSRIESAIGTSISAATIVTPKSDPAITEAPNWQNQVQPPSVQDGQAPGVSQSLKLNNAGRSTTKRSDPSDSGRSPMRSDADPTSPPVATTPSLRSNSDTAAHESSVERIAPKAADARVAPPIVSGAAAAAPSYSAGLTALQAQPSAHPHAPAAVAPLRDIAGPRIVAEPTRTAALKIDLAEGATAHASVRERNGGVEVRIVTNNSPVAQHLTAELGGLRRAFDAAGLRLNQAGVSYRGDGRSQRRDDPPAQSAPRAPREAKAFAEYEAE